MSLPLIRSLLETRLKAWAAAHVPPLAIAWQNVAFTPPAGMYLRSFILPGQTDSLDLSGEHSAYVGVHQVSVVCPAGVGQGAGERLAQEIVDLYPLNLPLTRDGFEVKVFTKPFTGSAIPDEDVYVLPVSYSYRADTA